MHYLCAVKRIMHYVARTVGYGLHHVHNDQFKFVGYSDSDLGRGGGSQDDRISTIGWCFSLGSAFIAWS